MQKKYKHILEIPFSSKAIFYKKKTLKYRYSGNAYFLLNEDGKVLRDFIILDGLITYRPNDPAMMEANNGKGTSCWQEIKDIRRSFFPTIKINYQIYKSDKTMVKNLNCYSIRKLSTCLNMDKIITGSNPSGANLTIGASPLICIDPIFYGLRFINSFKALRILKNNKGAELEYTITNEEIDKAYKMNLKEYFDKFPFYRNEFIKFNPDHQLNIDPNASISFLHLKSLKNNEKEKLFLNEASIKAIEKFSNQEMPIKYLVNRLRSIQRTSLILEFTENNQDVIIGKPEKVSNMDAAHILEVRYIKKKKLEFRMISDVNNGLLLPKGLHWKIDKDEDYYIDNDFKIKNKNGNTEYSINDVYVNEKRKKYIEMRKKYL